MKFEQHGIYSVEVNGRVLITDARGPFNDTTLQNYTRDVKKAVLHLSGAPWGQIIVLHGLSLFTPDAEQLLFDSTNWRMERDLSACAVVLIEPEAEDLIRTQLSRIYGKAGLEHQFFPHQKAAMLWLEKLF